MMFYNKSQYGIAKINFSKDKYRLWIRRGFVNINYVNPLNTNTSS